MFTFCSRIAVPYDHSELSKKALNMALTLAKQDKQIELEVLMVIQPKVPITYSTIYLAQDRNDSLRKEAQEIKKEIDQKLMSLPNRTKTIILEGNPAQIITEYVRENDSDLVVMGSRGLSGIKEMFLGSVSHNVVQKVSCPVLIVK